MSMFSSGSIDVRVTALEVQVKSMSEALKDGLRDIKDLIESKTNNQSSSRRFTITMFVGSLATLCALVAFMTNSCVESKIHPIEVRLSLLEHDLKKPPLASD